MLTEFAQMTRNWWMYLVRGVLAIVFGIMALVWPESAKVALVIVFGAFALADGILAVAAGIASRSQFKYWWALVLEGITGIIIGLMAFFWTNATGLALVYMIGIWAILTGIFEIVAAIEFRQLIPGEWLTFLLGVLSILAGVLLFANPSSGAVAIVWVIGMYAILFGTLEIVFSFRLRGVSQDLKAVTSTKA